MKRRPAFSFWTAEHVLSGTPIVHIRIGAMHPPIPSLGPPSLLHAHVRGYDVPGQQPTQRPTIAAGLGRVEGVPNRP
jgi:hypothetical protein